MSASTVAAPAPELSTAALRRLGDRGYRPVEGGYRHRACREVVADPDIHDLECDAGKALARGYVLCEGGGYLHTVNSCSARTDDMDVHDRECGASRISRKF